MTAHDNKWSQTTLGEVCTVNPDKPRLATMPDTTPVLFVPMAALDESSGQIATPIEKTLGEIRNKSYTSFAPGDVIFAKITPCMENGKAAVVPPITTGLGFGSTEFHVLRPNHQVDPRFIWHLVRQESFRRDAEAHMTGSVGQARVPATFLQNFAISLPSEPLQKELVRLLDATNEARGNVARHLAAVRRTIERFRQSVLAAACSGRLTADWRNRNPVSSKGAAASSRRAHSELPESWQWMPLRDVADVRGGIQKHPKRAPKQHAYPYLRVANVLRGKLDLSEIHQFELFNDELNTYRLMRGDLLVVEGNGSPSEIGRAALWDGAIEDCVHQNHIIRVRPFAVDPEYLQIYWNSPIAARAIADLAVTTAGLYSLSTGRIASVPIALPPAPEQSAVVALVKRLQSMADSVEREIEDATLAVDRSSAGLLRAAFPRARL